MALSEGIPADDISRQWCCSVRQTVGMGVVVYVKCFSSSWVLVTAAVVLESLPRCQEQSEIIPESQLTPLGSSNGTAPPHSSRAYVGR